LKAHDCVFSATELGVEDLASIKKLLTASSENKWLYEQEALAIEESVVTARVQPLLKLEVPNDWVTLPLDEFDRIVCKKLEEIGPADIVGKLKVISQFGSLAVISLLSFSDQETLEGSFVS
jgi:hypothetical protein